MTKSNVHIPFSPLRFLASLGAGGIAIMPFAFFQYTHHQGKGLIDWSKMGHGTLPLEQEVLFYTMEGVMIFFTLLHFFLTGLFIKQFLQWRKTEAYRATITDPLKNATILAPFVSIGMSFNVVIGAVRFFIPVLSQNLQAMMLPALLAWAVLWLALLRTEIKLLGTSFATSFDVSKINFGWLLHPFALGMITVTGTGIAAMSKTAEIAHTAAFMSVISGTMGFFLLTVKTIAIFKSHFSAPGLPEKQFLPSLLIVVPNITLFAISAFRLVHYMEHQFDAHLHWLAQVIVVLSFGMEVWYMAFGVYLLVPYFKKNVFHSEFHVSQWGLICPFVAFAVLGSFFYKLFVPNPVGYVAVIVTMIAAVALYSTLLSRALKCAAAMRKSHGHDCSNSLVPSPVKS